MSADRIIKNKGKIIFQTSNGGAYSTNMQIDNTDGKIKDGAGNPISGGGATVQIITLSGNTAAINWSSGAIAELDLQPATNDVVITASNPVSGNTYILTITQASTSRAIAWPANFLFETGRSAISGTNDAVDLITAVYDGTNYLCTMKKNVTPSATLYSNIYGWGEWTSYGLFGNGVTDSVKPLPIQAQSGTSYTAISHGYDHTMAIKADGSAWGLGRNDFGMLGINTAADSSSFQAVAGGHSFSTVTAGQYHTVALRGDGTAWCWGYNGNGALGDSSLTHRSSPISVIGGNSYTQVTAGRYQSWGLKTDGTVWGWGALNAGDTSSPSQITGTNSYVEISAGGTHVLARKADGSVWGFGTNSFGQLGNDSTTNSNVSFVQVVGGHSFVQVDAGYPHSLARKADGTIWGWGYSSQGQLGQNSEGVSSYRSSPVSVIGNHSFVDIACGDSAHCIARKADGSTWAWGATEGGNMGDGANTHRSSPVSVIGGHSFVGIATGLSQTSGRKADGTIWAWGSVRLGLAFEGYLSPTLLSFPFLLNIFSTSFNASARKVDGSALCWGIGGGGELGDNTATSKATPAQVFGGHVFTAISGGNRANFGLKADGTLWAWGYNNEGELGVNDTAHRSMPTQVVGGHIFVDVRSGCGSVNMARKADGSLWGWGDNGSGQLGNNTSGFGIPSPVAVVGGHSFVEFNVGFNSTCARKADGSVWSWGDNTNGQVGDITTVNKSSPISVAGGHSFISISSGGQSHVLALKANGEVWAWGIASSGQLGDNTVGDKSSPVSVVGGHSFIEITTSTYRGSFARKADGSVWAWGSNTSGYLGDGTLVNKSSPVQILASGATKLFPGGKYLSK